MSTLPGRLFLGILLTFASAAPPVPRNVTLTSQNFQHILTWQPGDVLGTSFLYRVNYTNISSPPEGSKRLSNFYAVIYVFEFHPRKSSGDRIFHVPEHCFKTSDLKCDLTDELTDVFGVYYIQLQSLSPNGNGSEWVAVQFNPLNGTSLGPPIVHLTANDSSINVIIQPPVSYLKSDDKTGTKSLLDVYYILKYIVMLKGPRKIDLVIRMVYLFESTILTLVFGVLAAIAVMTLLIVLNATGVICFRSPPFPKALCSFPKSESAFRENEWKVLTEKVCPVDIIFKEKRKKDYDGEETDESDTEAIREDYACRIGVHTNSSNVADNSNSGDLQTLAGSSLVDVSSHETLSTEPTDSEEHQSLVSDESGASKGMTPLMDVHCSSVPLDNSGSFNVNLASVMLGTLPKLQKDDVASEALSQGDQDSSVSSQDSRAPLLAFDFNLLIDKIGAVETELPSVSHDCFSNEALLSDESESEDSVQNQVSEYMRR